MLGVHLTSLKTPAIGHRYQQKEVFNVREDRNLIQTWCSLVVKREKDGDVFRLSRFTVENHEQEFTSSNPNSIKEQIFSSVSTLAFWKKKKKHDEEEAGFQSPRSPA